VLHILSKVLGPLFIGTSLCFMCHSIYCLLWCACACQINTGGGPRGPLLSGSPSLDNFLILAAISEMSYSVPSCDGDIETVAEFTELDDERQPVHCQKPLTGGRCYNPLGPENPPDGVLHLYTSKSNNTGYSICTPCKNHMDGKSTTITRRRPPQEALGSPLGNPGVVDGTF
jgi:hypothetical protein